MLKTVLAVAAAATAVTATPALAQYHHHYYRHHHMVNPYRVGYVFGPDYSYTEYTALPGPIVTRYHLRHNFRYVYRNGVVYVVNPRTYRVVRVIPG